MRLEHTLDAAASQTLQQALQLDDAPSALLRPTADPTFGDYQLNAAMALAKRLRRPPRELAEPIAEAMARHPAIARAEVAGPGFVNLWLDAAWVGRALTEDAHSERLGIEEVTRPETIVVDYSSPNIAKQMHVGHLRSTIIGHAVVQLLSCIGHRVIRDNHLGDWGTQYGWLIVGMKAFGDEAALEANPIVELERIYAAARKRGESDPSFAEAARAELAKLQAGDAQNHSLWERFVRVTRASLDAIYERLGVGFDEWLGESAYHDALPGVVEELLEKGIAREDQGATCVFFHDLPEPLAAKVPKKLRKQKQPFIVRKGDGAFLYSTTDIATVKHRREAFGADRSVYVVGAPQQLHFAQLAAIMGMLGEDMRLDHVAFGQILGADGRKMSTRDGGTVSLASLLDAAEAKALEKIEEQRAAGRLRIAAEDVEQAAKVIGIGAVKFADLSKNRMTDYRFDLDAMVDFSGYAGPYLQYQYARTRSIFETGGVDFDAFEAPIAAREEREIVLAKRLLRFPDVVHAAAEGYAPHFVCEHLYEVAKAFSGFFDQCPVLRSEGEVRTSRLALTRTVGLQLRRGLALLGIEVLERM